MRRREGGEERGRGEERERWEKRRNGEEEGIVCHQGIVYSIDLYSCLLVRNRSLKASTCCLGTECSSVIGQALICTLTGTEGTNPHTNAEYSVLGWRGPFLYKSGKSFTLLASPSTNVVE